MPDERIKSKTGNAQVRVVGHTEGPSFGADGGKRAKFRGVRRSSK